MTYSAARAFIGTTLVTAFFLVLAQAAFASSAEPAWKFNRSFNEWTRSLNVIEQRYGDPDGSAANAPAIREELLTIRQEASDARETANGYAAETENLLAALGPRPAEGEPEEASDVAAKRQSYEAEVADFRGRAAQAQLVVRRTDTLLADLSRIEQGQALRTLLTKSPSPLAWATIADSPLAAWVYASHLAEQPIAWWRGAAAEQRERLQGPAIILSILLLIIAAAGSRRALVQWLGRDETIAEPSYTRRLLGASVEALANGLLPVIVAAILWFAANRLLGLEQGGFRNLIEGALAAALIITTAIALPRAALSPALPNWRVAPIKPQYARHLTSRIAALGILFGIDTFIGFTATEDGTAFLTVYNALIATLEAVLILDLLRPALWRADPNWRAGGEKKEPPAPSASPALSPAEETHPHVAWRLLRIAIAAIAIIGALAAWAGYTALSVYLIGNLIGSAIVVGALFLGRALMEEWIDIAMQRNEIADWLNLSDDGARTVNFWLVGLLHVLVYLVGATLIGTVWGIPLSDLWTLVYNLLTAFEVGGVTISLTDIFEALLVLLVALLIFRTGKRLLRQTILPQTKLDPGAQYSIATIFGYAGIVTSVLLSAVVLGIEFQNLIIIAGALSVGIGFGLQNIANNFISGLILLFERPIKVGDLIEIGDTLGHVTHINVRRTEIETFQRAEVMVPNSELVSTSVINWTHSDRRARIEINVGVAYGSNTELVRNTLLKAAETIDKVVAWPPADVLFLDFGDSSLNFQLRCFTSDVSSRITAASALRFEIDRLFREEGIQIPFPQRVLHMAQDVPPADADKTGGAK